MIKIDLTKAKAIAHKFRRMTREDDFLPHDELLMKKIPGVDLEEVEAARQAIRDKYAVIQSEIDAAQTAEELSEMLRANNIRPPG
jgi:SepF-like predicted cell division protein (DUF552 family)